MKRIAFPILALLQGCAGAPLIPDANRTEFMVRVWQLSPADVQSTCLVMGGEKRQDELVVGCSQFSQGVLTVYVTPPRDLHDDRAFQTIGHELWHGVAGKFHP